MNRFMNFLCNFIRKISYPGFLDLAIIITAALAAFFWFMASKVPVPVLLNAWDQETVYNKFNEAMQYSASLNSSAAVFSCLSALCMAIKAGYEFWRKICNLT